jgi:hypothetical protein
MTKTEMLMRKQTGWAKKKDKYIISFANVKDLQEFIEREKGKMVFSPVPHHK